MDIGKSIKRLRTARNMTQSDLAQHVGVRENMISNWERNTQVCTVSNLVKIAKALKVTPDDLVGFNN